jgi:hypothetical protein
VLAAALSLVAAAGGVLLAGPAHAQQATTGTLKFSGDKGEYISQGRSWSYDTRKGDWLTVHSENGAAIGIGVDAYNGDQWTLDFDSPGSPPTPGQPGHLSPGTYQGALRYGFNGVSPGLDLSGNGRGCNELTGTFTITRAVFGPDGYVQAFDATFEEHCENLTPALRGEVHISNPAPPTPTASATNPYAAPTSPSRAPAVASDGAASSGPPPNTVTLVVVRPVSGAQLIRTVAVITWGVTTVVGLLTVGIVMTVRGRRMRPDAVPRREDP